MGKPKLKPFKILTAEKFTNLDDVIEIEPNVEYSQDKGANWKCETHFGTLKFQTKKGALSHFKRTRGTAKII